MRDLESFYKTLLFTEQRSDHSFINLSRARQLEIRNTINKITTYKSEDIIKELKVNLVEELISRCSVQIERLNRLLNPTNIKFYPIVDKKVHGPFSTKREAESFLVKHGVLSSLPNRE